MNATVRQQDVGVWLTGQAGGRRRCWPRQCREDVLVSRPQGLSRSRESPRTSHPARLCGSASLWGPAVRSVSAQSWHCPAPPLSPSVTCLFRCAFSPLSCSSLPGRAADGGASELTSHLLYLREKSSLPPPFLVPTCFIMMERCCSLKHRWLCALCHPAEPHLALRETPAVQIQFFRWHRSCSASYITVCMQTLCLLLETGNMTS